MMQSMDRVSVPPCVGAWERVPSLGGGWCARLWCLPSTGRVLVGSMCAGLMGRFQAVVEGCLFVTGGPSVGFSEAVFQRVGAKGSVSQHRRTFSRDPQGKGRAVVVGEKWARGGGGGWEGGESSGYRTERSSLALNPTPQGKGRKVKRGGGRGTCSRDERGYCTLGHQP